MSVILRAPNQGPTESVMSEFKESWLLLWAYFNAQQNRELGTVVVLHQVQRKATKGKYRGFLRPMWAILRF